MEQKIITLIKETIDKGLERKENAVLGPKGIRGEKGEQGQVGDAPAMLDGGNF